MERWALPLVLLAACETRPHAPIVVAPPTPTASTVTSAPEPEAPPAPPPPPAPPLVLQIDAAGETTCARLADGTARCWGRNEFDVIGEHGPDDIAVARPTPIDGLGKATQISISPSHACALLEGATVSCWGYDCGDLGIGNPMPLGPCHQEPRPKPVLGLRGVRQLSAHYEACALLDDGTVTCWADYDRGNGDPRDEGSKSPVAITNVKSAAEVATGQRMAYACVRLTSGGVRCWQPIAPGRVPKNKVRMDPAPVVIDDAVTLAIGDAGGCAVTTKGAVKCWGHTALYTAPATDARAKTQPEWKEVVQLGLGSAFACARTVSGEVSCKWQDGARETVAGASGAVELTTGNDHACVRKSDGSVHCWGENAYGQLGDGTKTSRRNAAPVRW